MGDDDAPTGLAPTEVASAAVPDETEAVTAWALDDDEEWEPARRWWTPGRITTIAIAVSLLIMGVAAGVAGYHLRPPPADPVAAESVPSPSTTTQAPPPTPRRAGWGLDEVPPPPATKTETVIVEKPAAPPPVSRAPYPDSPNTNIPAEQVAFYDRQMIASLRQQGWAIWNEAQMARDAHTACAALEGGTPSAVVVEYFTGGPNNTPMSDAQVFVNTVMSIYPDCP